MNIDSLIKNTIDNNSHEINISFDELNSIWNSVENHIDKSSSFKKHNKLKPIINIFNFKDFLEVAVFILVLVLVPFAVNNYKYISKSALETGSSKNINTYQSDGKNIVIKNNNSIANVNNKFPEVVLYNSHNSEAYDSGKKISSVSEELNEKLLKLGFKSTFLNSDNDSFYNTSYQNSKKLIEDNIKDYNKKILLDIHRDSPTNGNKKVLIILSQSNPSYEQNKKFAELLINEINKSSNVKGSIFHYKNGIDYFNQQLSPKALLVDIGSESSSNEDIEQCLNVFSQAIYKIFNEDKLK